MGAGIGVASMQERCQASAVICAEAQRLSVSQGLFAFFDAFPLPWLTIHPLERVQEGCSSGATALSVLSEGVSRPSQSFEQQTDHGEVHHTLATTG